MDGTSISFWDVTLDVTQAVQGRAGSRSPCDKSLTGSGAPASRVPASWDEKGPNDPQSRAKGHNATAG
ncbi:hypothetical protein GCM10010388_38700 [Streptomyces mauvecolor]